MPEGNGTKIGIGCCSAVTLVICALLLVGVIWGKKAWTYIKTAAQEQTEMMAIVGQWEASLDGATATLQSVSPESVGEFRRSQQVLDAAAPGFSLEATGQLDVFQAGGDEVRVWITGTSHLDMTTAIEKIKLQLDDRFSSKSTKSFNMNGKGRLSYSGSPPYEKGLMVNSDGHILLIQSNEKSVDLQEFLIDYVEAGMTSIGAGNEVTDVPDESEAEDSIGGAAADIDAKLK